MTGLARDIEYRQTDGAFTASFTAMGSPCEILIETADRSAAEDLSQQGAAEAWRIEAKFSRYLSGNIIDRINTAGGEAVIVDDETARLLDFAKLMFEISGGKFDITSGVLRRAWTFDGGDAVPSQKQIDASLKHVGWNKISWKASTIRMPVGMQIDLGGIGKEFAVDRVADILRSSTTASCLVNFGGDLAATRPPSRRKGWRVGIEAIKRGKIAEKLIDLKSGALATSGDARRFLVKDAVRYGHILDPDTGWPIENAPRSVTVAADTCTQAGMLATLSMLKGEAAEAFLEKQSVKFWCLR
jgi:thiamine biosynthesis lipoprotein